jgi:transmembrane sensor
VSAPALHPEDRRARREAATWLVKHDRGLTAAEQDEFFQWLAADPRHGAWYARHRGGWERLDGVAAWLPADGKEPNPDMLARPAPQRRPVWPWVAGLAAAIALAAGFALRPTTEAERATAVAAVVPVAEAGGYERRELEDGSVVELNRGAAIDVSFSATERRIALRGGEALFTVRKDGARPFTVRAGGVEVRAVGTAFNVRLAAQSVEVLVTEGKVQVAPPVSANATGSAAARPLVVAGERALVALAADAVPQIARATPAELERVRGWQPQLLDFSSTPLAEAVAEFNRRNRVQLVLEDDTRAALPIVASIRSDNLDGFVSLIAAPAGLRAERRGDYEIVLRAAP